MTHKIDFSTDTRHLAIVANVERLLSDAQILLEQGSPGTSLATAILAFEEAGKGQRLSIGLDKPKGKGSPSWHVFRQQVAALVLIPSLSQKYGLYLPKFDGEVERHFEERRLGSKNLNEILNERIPDAILGRFLERGIPGFDRLSADDRLLLRVELRWVRKIFITAATGQAEVERQGGLYVDMEDENVTSDPTQINRLRAAYWINVAERSLGILRDGDFASPYGQLAAFLETLPKPLPSMESLNEHIQKLALEAHD